MTTAALPQQRQPELAGQTVVVIGGTSGIGLATATRARHEGAGVILTGRHTDSLQRVAGELDPLATAAFDANDPAQMRSFFDGLGQEIDHVMIAAGSPDYGRLLQMAPDALRTALGDRILLAIEVARNAVGKLRPGGTLLLMTAERAQPALGSGAVATVAAALPALVANLALELAPIRINLIAAGFVDTPLSASLLGGDLDKRRGELAATLPIGRVVEPADVAALAIHLMANTALTGATYTIDGGQRLVGA